MMAACGGVTVNSNVRLASSISTLTFPIAGRQTRVRFPLYASYDLVYLSNSACNASGNSSVSFLNFGQYFVDNISDVIWNGSKPIYNLCGGVFFVEKFSFFECATPTNRYHNFRRYECGHQCVSSRQCLLA